MLSAATWSSDTAAPRATGDIWNGPLQREQVALSDVRWAVGRSGDAARPALLLLHGTGSAMHTWRDLGPRLARHFEVLAPDLPGHGDSVAASASAMTLDGMASAVARLLRKLEFAPRVIVGHSAGAALGAELCVGSHCAPELLIAINGAFLPYGGPAQSLLAPLAGMLAGSGLVTRYVASQAVDLDRVDRLIRSTGSRLDEQGLKAYQATLASPERVRATLTMMAKWRIDPLFRALARLEVPLHLIVGRRDAAVSPWQAERVLRQCGVAWMTELPSVGHLAHEEDAGRVADLIIADATARGVIAAERSLSAETQQETTD
ncbi:MAG: alpha/beta fold hydrolase BchO [Pseudomonadota bacterium]